MYKMCSSINYIFDIPLSMILKCHFLIASWATKANIIFAPPIFLEPSAMGLVASWTAGVKYQVQSLDWVSSALYKNSQYNGSLPQTSDQSTSGQNM